MNDPLGILEEFVSAARAVPTPLADRFDGVHPNCEPEHLRATYRRKHEETGLCRSCTRDAKPGRKYCLVHLAKANERARRSLKGTASP